MLSACVLPPVRKPKRASSKTTCGLQATQPCSAGSNVPKATAPLTPTTLTKLQSPQETPPLAPHLQGACGGATRSRESLQLSFHFHAAVGSRVAETSWWQTLSSSIESWCRIWKLANTRSHGAGMLRRTHRCGLTVQTLPSLNEPERKRQQKTLDICDPSGLMALSVVCYLCVVCRMSCLSL